ncbi:hypothetical protein [Pseudomonas sp. FFUP_PS_41]|uniref:hypothetical protein n=1 Tax=Pseudomonas sp. FFUP_PS_41 TaxID=2060417 RepID=UPI000C7CA0DA|nr:hypothetical protein [Pseudomonas sp. FFUP_PS_41]PLP85689.1 hypothetical protein CX682_30225 [Pseudomonas sp. FFUP_PS_41]
MQLIIAALLFLIALYVVPWLFGIVVMALGAYAFVVVAAGGVVLLIAVVIGIWHGVTLLRERSARKRASQAFELIAQRSQAEEAALEIERRRMDEIRAASEAAEAEKKEQLRVKRLVACVNCSSMITRGSMYCPVCGKPPVTV